jgi:deazaflavin-dependent oxidoreductase (nitroreductase family)
MTSWNDGIIEEFHGNNGKVGGRFEGAPLLLLTTTGARSGQARVAPMRYFDKDGTSYVIASKGGAPTNPDWYHNLIAHPEVHVEKGTDAGIETFDATAEPIVGDERDRLFAWMIEVAPGFGDYQEKTSRVIPVIALHRS